MLSAARFAPLLVSSPIIPVWSNQAKHADIVLSNGGLTATQTASGTFRSVLATKGVSAGKGYFEATIGTGNHAYIGIGQGSTSLSQQAGVDAISYGYYSNSGGILFNNGSVGSAGSWATSGEVACVAVDLTAGKLWFRKGPAGSWHSGDPAAGTGGLSISTGLIWYPEGSVYQNVQLTANFGASSFSGAVPAGFLHWDAL